MVSFQNIDVEVKCGHHRATEYLDDDNPNDEPDNDEPDSINRYIEVRPNELWRVKGTVGRHFDWQNADIVVMRVYLDGKHSASRSLHRPKFPGVEVVGRLDGAWSGSSEFLRFKFADLETRESVPHRVGFAV